MMGSNEIAKKIVVNFTLNHEFYVVLAPYATEIIFEKRIRLAGGWGLNVHIYENVLKLCVRPDADRTACLNKDPGAPFVQDLYELEGVPLYKRFATGKTYPF